MFVNTRNGSVKTKFAKFKAHVVVFTVTNNHLISLKQISTRGNELVTETVCMSALVS